MITAHALRSVLLSWHLRSFGEFIAKNWTFDVIQVEDIFRCLNEDFSKITAFQTLRFQTEDSSMTIYKLCKFEGNL